jgi:hypothetical protein
MTAIVGLVDAGSVYIGGDSAGVAGMSMTVRADAKVFRKKRYLFGFTTSFRMGQLIRYSLKVPKVKGNLDAFMATTFVDALRDCGDQVALGALLATADAGLSPRRRVLRSLAAAERFSAGVRGPFVCLKAPAS